MPPPVCCARSAVAVALGLWITAHHLLLVVGSHRVTPFNVTVRELSESSALVTWSLFADQEDDQMNSTNQTTENPMMPFRLEITYRPYRQRKRMIIAVPSDVTSYILSDLRPGSDYMIRVTSVTKGLRVRSQPVRFSLSQVVSAGPSPDSRDDAYLSPPSYPSYGGTVGDPSTYPMMPTFIAPPPRSPSSGPYRNNRLTGNYTSVVGLADYRFPPTANSAGVVYVRGEEVGIVILVLIVWVAAVALFFHRWGKIRMLLPYQPVFKEEEPVIVGLSPSPTPLQLSQPSQLLPSSSLSQSQPPVPPSAVHVSANKFVSLDPAAIRRNQFMLHSRLARMQAYTERRNWPTSMSRLDQNCIIVGRSPLPAVRQKGYASRRANTIAADTCDCCERPIGYCRKLNDPSHLRHHHKRGIHHPKFASGSGCSCEEPLSEPRKAHSAEVITLTVTSCESPTNSVRSNSTPELPERLNSPFSIKPQRPTNFVQQQDSITAECSL
ncbi:uncharacterized protein LOC124341045 isoform X2 [Daphnia pulicaria]|uniref:uncharacterized protein LOC124341045 isoform X2 n=1 Tax=Daphnia pulicaria TaxID=35523 RepID=UPI001EEA1251|nr:uncharacterized protein LOC124341045 isoform X2 [Daphnia pulicaria]